MKLELFPEQQKVVDDVSAAFRSGFKRVMVSAACGFGKTEIAAAMLQATYENGKSGQFIADRISLVNQTSQRFDKYDLPHGVMQADNPRRDDDERIQVCSIATLTKRDCWPAGNLMLVDEAHILSAGMKAKLQQRDRYAVGLSATAVTRGLGKYFDCVVNAPPTNRLIESGRLVPLHIFSCAEPDMNGVKVANGEWDNSAGGEGEKRVLQVVGDVVKEYIEHGNNEKFIGFGFSINHVLELQRQFIAAGINVATYTSDDTDEDKLAVLEEIRKPDSAIRGVLSVEALTRGFDVADIKVLILARPLREALHVHVQMLGRVMRAFPGKSVGTVLDHSGNCAHFWHQVNDLFENGVRELDDGTRKDKPKLEELSEEDMAVKCPKCNHMHKPRPSCPNCGYEYPRRKPMEHVPGTLKELVAGGNERVMQEQLWPQVCGFVLAEAKTKGLTDMILLQKRAQGIYAELTGATAMRRIENTEPKAPSAEVAGKIKHNRIRFARRKDKEKRMAREAVPA